MECQGENFDVAERMRRCEVSRKTVCKRLEVLTIARTVLSQQNSGPSRP